MSCVITTDTMRRYPSRYFSKKKESLAFNLPKSEVQKFILQNKPIEGESLKDMIPEEVIISKARTVAINDKIIFTNSTEGLSSTKNEKLQAFYFILFYSPNHFLIEKMSMYH